MRITKTKVISVVAATAVVALGGTAAMAYWTSGGTGTGNGSATTITPAAINLVVAQASAPSNMAPGVPAGAITATVTNPSATQNVYATQVVVSFGTIQKAAGAPAGTCDSSDYTLSNATMTTGQTDLAPAGVTTFSGATLGFFNKTGTNQDACKGATVNLVYTAS